MVIKMPIRVGILAIEQRDEDATQAVRQLLSRSIEGLFVMAENRVASQRYLIEEVIRQWCDEQEFDLVVTIGGTMPAPGPSSKEITPEATAAVVERLLPGLPEAMRAYAQEQSELALLDRSIAGIRGRSLILNLPSDAAPAILFLEAVVDLIEPILAHLHEQPNAPKLSDVLEIEALEDVANPNTSPLEAKTSPDSEIHSTPEGTVVNQSRLDPNEFAKFLEREKAKKNN